eukprot:TRINITY_DN17418_c0_g1_i1.p1 TRINITY_DN17418_c0_g1~~TRINITY_DN17418_c0_g1_i1.p1  ORF type:complete len:517 (+),score=143.36 TRINITY_DN17418_c0_g1_i1:85-1635(+)
MDAEAKPEVVSKKLNKNQKRKLKKKLRKQHLPTEIPVIKTPVKAATATLAQKSDVDVQYVSEDITLIANDEELAQMKEVFEAFTRPEELEVDVKAERLARDLEEKAELLKVKAERATAIEEKRKAQKEAKEAAKAVRMAKAIAAGETLEEDDSRLSRRQFKKQHQLSIGELKRQVKRPDLVEVWDVTSHEPKLLVELKSVRNSVEVPRHWCLKRRYLMCKRGYVKPPFELPDFIKATGIHKMRDNTDEMQINPSLSQKAKEKVRPKMGKIDIDFNVLHDAFFKYQTKPDMTIHGELYYENKEFETRPRDARPGIISDTLRDALGMSKTNPPPWLVNMQRYGPPPSYPTLKIPGLNMPIPSNCSYGYHTGGWGKPPVDEYGRALYGNPFDVLFDNDAMVDEDSELWGELISDEEVESSSDEDSDEEGAVEAKVEDSSVPKQRLTKAEESGIASVASTAGLATPAPSDVLDLRKASGTSTTGADSMEPKSLYTVLQSKSNAIGTDLFGSTHVYDVKTE